MDVYFFIFNIFWMNNDTNIIGESKGNFKLNPEITIMLIIGELIVVICFEMKIIIGIFLN